MTVLPVAFMVGQLPELEFLHRLAAFTQRGCLVLLVMVASQVRPRLGIRGRPVFMFGFALWTLPFLWTVTDSRTVLGHRFAWAVMVLAAIAVTRLCVDVETTWRLVLQPLRNGSTLALAVVAAGIVLDPNSLRSEFGRLAPWGANPNILASNLIAGLPLFGYSAWVGGRRWWMVVTGLTAGLVFITGSRGGYLAMAVIAIPFVFNAAKRPALTLTAMAGLLLAGSAFISVNPQAVGRADLGSVSSRVNIASQYLDVISSRPWVGLLGSRDQTATTSEAVTADRADVDLHAHNAYVQYAYWGGAALAVPLLVIAVKAVRSAWSLWRRRRLYDQWMLVSIIAWTTIALYVHGLTGIMMAFPTYLWAWLGLICTMLAWSPRALHSSRRATGRPTSSAFV